MGCKHTKPTKKWLNNQQQLRKFLFNLIMSYGNTGLYKSDSISRDADYNEFKKFCSNLKIRLEDSPRNNILNEISDQTKILYQNNEDVRELYKLLDINEHVNFIIVINKFNEVKPGRVYQKIEVYSKKSIYYPFSVEQSESAIVNKKAKFDFAEINYENYDWENFLDEIEVKRKERCQENVEKTKVEKKNLETDEEYLKYKRVNFLWNKYKFDKFMDQYNDIDYGIGKDRRTRGKLFEETHGDKSYLYIKNFFLNKYPNFEEEKFSVYYNCFWVNDNKNVGEMDLAIMYDDEPIAVGEQKSNYFDLVAGYHQHQSKIDLECKIKIPNKGIYSIKKDLDIFIVTLIPNHKNLLGTESKLIKLMGESLSDLGEYSQSKSILDYQIDDFTDFRELVQKKLVFSISPKVFLENNQNKVIVFDPHNKVNI
jgi:hypothetical protein